MTVKLNYLVSTILFLLLSSPFSTTTQPLETSPNTTTVLDAEGHDLQPDTKYYILPTQPGHGGGLVLAARDRPCPFYVMQETPEASAGLPLRFLAADTKQMAINLSTDVNIVFTGATICVQSTGWRVGGVDEVTGNRYVVSGGMIGRPGINTVSNWFKIEKNESGINGYKIVFCPSVCSYCKVVCGNVGVFVENGKRWLGLSDEPLLVMFKKI